MFNGIYIVTHRNFRCYQPMLSAALVALEQKDNVCSDFRTRWKGIKYTYNSYMVNWISQLGNAHDD